MPETQYYTLSYDPPNFKGLKPLPVVLGVDRFLVSPVYDSNKIIYQENPFRRDAYTYRRWRVNPGDLVTCFLTRDLGQSGLFKAAFASETGFPFSHVIEGVVDEFFEQDDKDEWKAVLSIDVILMAANEPDICNSVLFQKKYNIRETCRQKNPQSLAEAMSKAMARLSEQIIMDVYHHLAGSRPETALCHDPPRISSQ
jgi:ABC-type uncharacterized transport system auxiliary subunit